MPGKRKFLLAVLCFLTMFQLCIYSQTVYAAAKQSEIVTLEKQKDLTVMFSFDREVVDITFISPSGVRKTSNDTDVEYSSGDLWSTYRIKDAQAGTWSVEYDLQKNSEINYSIMEEDYGLWIQYFNISDITDDKAKIVFQADCEAENIDYSYEIYAISTTDETAVSKVATGNAKSNEAKELEIKLDALSDDDYVLRLDVYYRNGEAELFDTFQSESFAYHNPNEPNAIKDFKILVDIMNLSCEMNWKEFTVGGCDGYRLQVYENSALIYTGDFQNNITAQEVLFSKDATQLQIKLYYKKNNIWSAPQVKTVNLQEEYLKLASPEVTGAGTAVIEYAVASERTLYVNINDKEGNYRIENTGNLTFNLTEGKNVIYAQMEGDSLISYKIDTQVYYDANPPFIKLYENLDGKTFYTDDVNIIGTVSGCHKLTINKEEVTIDEQGEFHYLASLNLGENLIEIEAEDVNGNASKMVLTLYKASKITGDSIAKSGWVQFLPLVASLLTSVLIILLAFAFMHKKDKTAMKKTIKVWPWVLWDILAAVFEAGCIYGFVNHYRYSNSIKYIEMAEKSATKAAAYLRVEKLLGIASILGFIILIISMIITILQKKKQKITKDTKGVD